MNAHKALMFCGYAIAMTIAWCLGALVWHGIGFALLGYRGAMEGKPVHYWNEPQPNWTRAWFAWCARRGVWLGQRR